MKKALILAVGLLVLPVISLANGPASANSNPKPQFAPHGVGTNIVLPDGSLEMVAPNFTRRPYSSAGAFISYGFNDYASVVAANADDLALPVGAFILPADGKVYSDNSGANPGTLYLMSDDKKSAFASTAVFTGLGFTFANVISANLSAVPQGPKLTSPSGRHPRGVLINKSGTVFYTGKNGVYGIPDLATFNSWGFKSSDVVPATAGDKALAQVGVLPPRQVGELNPTVK